MGLFTSSSSFTYRFFVGCRVSLQVLQPVQSIDESLGAGNDNVRIISFAQGLNSVFLQSDRHTTLGISAAG